MKHLLYLLISPLVTLGVGVGMRVGVYLENMLLWESSKLTLSFLSGKAQTSHCTSLELRITVRTLPGHDW